MTEVLDPKPTDRVYEVGTGSGYQSAILSRLVKEVYSVEIHAPLSKWATQVHKELGYTNIHTRVGDGYEGWPDAAPFDSIIVTCAPEKVPQPLVDQLKEGGRLVIPLGTRFKQIVFVGDKHDGKVELKRAQAHAVRPDDRPGPARGGRRPRRGQVEDREGRREAVIRPAGRVREVIGGSRSPLGEKTRVEDMGTADRLASRRGDPGGRAGWGCADGPTPARATRRMQLIERTGPPELDDMETDANKDGIPDGWYNARDVSWIADGGAVGPHFLRFRATEPGRPARISRAFGVDGRKTEAIILGAVGPAERHPDRRADRLRAGAC